MCGITRGVLTFQARNCNKVAFGAYRLVRAGGARLAIQGIVTRTPHRTEILGLREAGTRGRRCSRRLAEPFELLPVWSAGYRRRADDLLLTMCCTQRLGRAGSRPYRCPLLRHTNGGRNERQVRAQVARHRQPDPSCCGALRADQGPPSFSFSGAMSHVEPGLTLLLSGVGYLKRCWSSAFFVASSPTMARSIPSSNCCAPHDLPHIPGPSGGGQALPEQASRAEQASRGSADSCGERSS
jgi:hypothetical protein